MIHDPLISGFYIADDDWRLEASTSVELAPGMQSFTLEYQGDVRVVVDNAEVASSTGVTSPRNLTAVFDHPGGRATIVIEAADSAGRFLLRWSE